ncbi:MAG: Lipoteichoic acid synthase 2 [Candidatus Dadabacteria bacterium]|nr:Lipoteichoic acid synthase 2 [Candidatus Dadabacteria bacterium]
MGLIKKLKVLNTTEKRYLQQSRIAVIKRIFGLRNQQTPINHAVKILCTGVCLFFFLLLIRSNIMGFPKVYLHPSSDLVLQKLCAGLYDLIYVLVITAFFLIMLLPIRKNQKAQRLLYFIYLGTALLSLIIAFLNIKAVEMLGRPFNYQWLYYSDFLAGPDVKNVILSNVSWKLLLGTFTLIIALLFVSSFLNCGINFLLRKNNLKNAILIALIVLLFIYLPLANRYISRKQWEYSKLENPVISFLQSIIVSNESPFLFTMKTQIGSEDFQLSGYRPLESSSIQNSRNSKIKNIIIFVLESVPTEYIEAYGGSYPVTPELNKYIKQSALFENIYAHAPATNYSLVSILCSIYPWIKYFSITREGPEINLPSLSTELKKHGFRTAFLNSADNRFQDTDEFLSHHHFDKIDDHATLNCKRQKFISSTEGWPFMDGYDDECIVDSFINWVSENPKQPFFGVLWTMMTHFPYFSIGKEINFGARNENLNRYLNALSHADKVLGKLLRWLENQNLIDSTLVVIVGDHGEAFGRHGHWVHATNLYEEGVHVPLIMINRMLFSGEEYSTIGGLIDIAPTIMDMLNFPLPEKWQGRSLFSNNRVNRVYFFAPWSNYLFGFRQDNYKFIFDASNNKYEIYDLDKDSQETRNLTEQLPDFVKDGTQRLAAWVQFQNKLLNDLMLTKPE